MKKLLLIIVLGLLTGNLFAQQIPICLIDSGSNPYRQMNGCKWFNAPIGVLSDPLTNFLVGGKVRTFVGQNFQYGVSLVLLVDSNFSFQAGNIDGRFGSGTTIKLSDTKQKIVLTTGIGSGLWLGEDFGKTVLGDYGGIGGHGTNVYVRDSALYRDVTINSGGATTLFNASGIKNSVLTTANGLVKIDGTGQFATTAATTSTGINLVTVPNPGITAFIRLNSDNSVSTRTSLQMVSDLGLGSMAKADSTGFFHKSDTVITVVTKNYAATTFPNVTKSGENYLTLTGQAIAANAVNLATSNVTGVLPVANGGFDPNIASSFTNGAYFGSSAPVVVRDQVYTSTDAGIYSSNADEQIATFDLSIGQYTYGNGAIVATGSAITLTNYNSPDGIFAATVDGELYQIATSVHPNYTLHADNAFRQLNLATDAGGINSPDHGGTGIDNGTNTLTLGGSLITTGVGTPTLAFPSGSFTYTYPLAASTLFANNLGLSGGSIHIGGTATTDALKLRSTSGVGTTGADIIFQTGNNGATEVGRFLNAGQLGIGVSSPTAILHLKAGTATASTAPLKFNSGTNLTTAEAGAMEFDGTNLYFSPSTTRYRVMGIGTPTIAAGVGAGTSPTISVAGNDGSMTVSVTTGTLPTGTNAVVATITFNKTWGSTPRVVFSPANAITALLSGASMVYMDAAASTTTFVITSGTTALTAATAYKWNVHCVQ